VASSATGSPVITITDGGGAEATMPEETGAWEV
jgi:hypothetical protein